MISPFPNPTNHQPLPLPLSNPSLPPCPLGPPQALYPAYIDRYYASHPPVAEPQSTTNASKGAVQQEQEQQQQLGSWAQLEAACGANALFQRFTSPSMHVRAFSSTAILFNVRVGLCVRSCDVRACMERACVRGTSVRACMRRACVGVACMHSCDMRACVLRACVYFAVFGF